MLTLRSIAGLGFLATVKLLQNLDARQKPKHHRRDSIKQSCEPVESPLVVAKNSQNSDAKMGKIDQYKPIHRYLKHFQHPRHRFHSDSVAGPPKNCS